MNKIFAVILILVSSTTFGASVRGYIVQNGGITSFGGLVDDGRDIYIPLNQFNPTQIQVAYSCMRQRETYAVLVETQSSRKVLHTVYSYDYDVVKVSCVRAPGFINYWRTRF